MATKDLPNRSHEPFPIALGALLRALQEDPLRPVTMRQLFLLVQGYTYDALRKMTRGELTLQPEAMEAIAQAAKIIEPTYFREYRLWQIDQAFSQYPEMEDEFYDAIMEFARHFGRNQGEAPQEQRD